MASRSVPVPTPRTIPNLEEELGELDDSAADEFAEVGVFEGELDDVGEYAGKQLQDVHLVGEEFRVLDGYLLQVGLDQDVVFDVLRLQVLDLLNLRFVAQLQACECQYPVELGLFGRREGQVLGELGSQSNYER